MLGFYIALFQVFQHAQSALQLLAFPTDTYFNQIPSQPPGRHTSRLPNLALKAWHSDNIVHLSMAGWTLHGKCSVSQMCREVPFPSHHSETRDSEPTSVPVYEVSPILQHPRWSPIQVLTTLDVA